MGPGALSIRRGGVNGEELEYIYNHVYKCRRSLYGYLFFRDRQGLQALCKHFGKK